MKKINVKGAVMKVAATGAGAVAAASLNKITAFTNIAKTPLIRGVVKIALGAFLPQILGKGKSAQLFADAGSGAIATGSLELANATVFKGKPLAISGTQTLGDIPAHVYVDE